MDLAKLKQTITQTEKLKVCADSRQVCPGDIFVAIKGSQVDGHDFAADAIERGAHYIVTQQPLALPESIEQISVAQSTAVFAELAACQYQLHDRAIRALGITGTNGKTTVAYLTRAILQHSGRACGLLGTVEYDLIDHVEPAGKTTPDALELARYIRQMADQGAEHVVMECSSHGLDQDRCSGIDFAAAAFTNISGDHLDYHGNHLAYLNAKGKLFRQLSCDAVAIFNYHVPESEMLAENTKAKCRQFGFDRRLDIFANVERIDISGSQWQLNLLGETAPVDSPLIGQFNISNALAAAGLAKAAGIGIESIAAALSNFDGIPGRLERINGGQNFSVLVDYAHTDDALKNVLESITALKTQRLVLVFGCGGNRDHSKRARMAAISEKFADVVIITNDNPRFEDPDQILADIKCGFSNHYLGQVVVEPDRKHAIELALNMAQKDDVVIIAGKGHECYQEIEGIRHPLDDRAMARTILAGRNSKRRKDTLTLYG